ncbi:uncharacterized protein LOC117294620 [Asterias rubens]|uniref:Gonadotropin-releasing hormone-type peptide n=1 Tax=Asterias rubens TaxID=7604 RepID=A0A0U2NQT5_ASTRU|nr:uncharacterized protein LOC117294620 [Asterias rubens]ALJ99954.1 gonadotropin-releasing hormone-type peptide precursor [Asterias rubens]
MADMRMLTLTSVLVSLLFMAEIQRCQGQIHYKNPGWGPGGKRSSHMTGSNVLRKRHWRVESDQMGTDSMQKERNLIMLQEIAKSLAKQLVVPTSEDDTVLDQLTVDQWRQEADEINDNGWN